MDSEVKRAKLYAAVEWQKLGRLAVRVEHHGRNSLTASGIRRTCYQS